MDNPTHLPLDCLVENPRNERKTFHGMDGLIATVRELGVVEPITVVPHGDGRYMIVTGHRRYRAAKAAGLESVPVHIDAAGAQTRHKSLISNIQREDLPPLELAQALQSLLDEDDNIKSQKDLARVIGKSEVWVSNVLSLLKLPTAYREKIWSTKFPISVDALTRIVRIGDPRKRKRLLEYLLTGASTSEVRAKIAADTARTTEAPRTVINGALPTSSSSCASSSSTNAINSAALPGAPPLHAPRVFRTRDATVAVAFVHPNASRKQTIEALYEAVRQARKIEWV